MARTLTQQINRTIDDFTPRPPGASWVPLTYVPADVSKITATLLGAGALSIRMETSPRNPQDAIADPLTAPEYHGKTSVTVMVLWPDRFDVTPGEVLTAAQTRSLGR